MLLNQISYSFVRKAKLLAPLAQLTTNAQRRGHASHDSNKQINDQSYKLGIERYEDDTFMRSDASGATFLDSVDK